MGIGPRISSSAYDSDSWRQRRPPSGPPYTSSLWDYYDRSPDGKAVLKARYGGPGYFPPAFGQTTQATPWQGAPNPNPHNHKIKLVEEIEGFLIIQINYPDATNFEGEKILVFDRGVTATDLLTQGAIDPHFGVNPDFIHPIARFIPTPRGLDMARRFCEASGDL